MKSNHVALVFVAALVAAAGANCKADNKPSEGGGTSAGGAIVSLSGSGSTFQKAFQEAAIDAYVKGHGNVRITYGGGGSGKGRKDLSDRITDFAGSDSAWKDDEKANIKGGEILYFPILLGPIAVSYNVDGVDTLRLSVETIAKIFQGDIKKWNDPAITAENEDVKLPDSDIAVAHRADGSGTTENFTKYLDRAGKPTWRLKSGSTVDWPRDQWAGQGNGGVAQIIKDNKGTIGYVDFSDAKAAGLKYAKVKNQAGKYVEPAATSASAAAEGIDIKDDLTFSALDARGDAAYPITYQSWVIVYAQPDKEKAAAIKDYLKFLLTDAQGQLPALDFAPLPKTLQDKAMAQLDRIRG